MKRKSKEMDIADRPFTTAELKAMGPWMRFDELPAEMQNALRSRGRPVAEHPKEKVTVRLDHDILAAFRNKGRGWQTQLNALLRTALQNGQI